MFKGNVRLCKSSEILTTDFIIVDGKVNENNNPHIS